MLSDLRTVPELFNMQFGGCEGLLVRLERNCQSWHGQYFRAALAYCEIVIRYTRLDFH